MKEAQFHFNIFTEKFIFFYFRVFGISPITYEKPSPTIFKTSKIGVLYNIFLFGLLCVTGYVGMKYMLETNYRGRLENEVLIIIVSDLSWILRSLFIVVVFCIRQERIVNIMSKNCVAVELAVKLNKNKHTLKSSEINKRCIFCLVNMILFIMSFYAIFQQNIHLMCYAIINSFHLSIISAIYLQYSLIVENIRGLFKLINNCLSNILKNSHTVHIIEQSSYFAELDQTTHLYSLLSETTEDVSNFYSFFMLCCTLSSFLSLFTNLYCCIKIVTVYKNELSFIEIIWNIYNIYFEIVALPLLTISVSNTVNEVTYSYLFYFLIYS